MAAPSLYAGLLNLRAYLAERLETRAGQSSAYALTGASSVHSIRRLYGEGGSVLLFGADTKLYSSASTGSAVDTGYSGNPLCMVPFRPANSPQAWMYIADSDRMSKVSVDGTTRYDMGIAPPLNPPATSLGEPAFSIMDKFSSVGSWAGSQGGSSVSLSHSARWSSNVTAWLNDSGTSGWACIVVATLTNAIQEGMLVTATESSTSETQPVQKVLPNVLPSSVTIEGIAYTSGTTGECVITLSTPLYALEAQQGWNPADNGTPPGAVPAQPPSPAPITASAASNQAYGLQRDSVLLLNSGGGTAEYVRVESLRVGPQGYACVTCTTVNNHAAAESVEGAAAIRCYFVNSFDSSATLKADAITGDFTAGGVGTISLTSDFNLSVIGSNAVPLQSSDYIHFGFMIDNIASMVEMRLLLDVDASTNDFAHNYYYVTLRPSDLQAALGNIRPFPSAQQIALSIYLTGNAQMAQSWAAYAYPQQAAIPGGSSTWIQVSVPVSALTKVGNDQTASLASVKAVRFQFNMGASANIYVSSLWFGGGSGPDWTAALTGYLYRYQPRAVKTTGARGWPSPATIPYIYPVRQQVVVALTQHPDAQVDTLDVFRFGGTLNSWLYVGSVANGSSPKFYDSYADGDLNASNQLSLDNLQPFPDVDLPRSGTVDTVGSTVTWVSGDHFNTAWAPGTQINIGGIFYTLYQQPSSTTSLTIVENAGTQSGASFYIQNATLLGQPLPSLWGPFSQGTALFCFACGSSYQPGVLFLTNGNDPDSASDVLQIEITPPSDPLVNGCMFGNGNAYVWSANRMFSLYPSFGSSYVVEAGQVLPAQGQNLFVPLEVQNGKGLWSRWALAVGPKMWFLARDGIYETTGGAPTPISEGPWATLFPHDGRPGAAVTIGALTIQPPDMTQTAYLRLCYYDSHLYFDYRDASNNQWTLVYNTDAKVWSVDQYGYPAIAHYGDEAMGSNAMYMGAGNGSIYQMTGTLDGAAAISYAAYMPTMSELRGGYQTVRDGYVGYIASGAPTLTVQADGVSTTTALTAASQYQRSYVPVPAAKARLWEWAISGSGTFTLFLRDCEFRARTWGDPGPYLSINPFASPLRAAAPKIT